MGAISRVDSQRWVMSCSARSVSRDVAAQGRLAHGDDPASFAGVVAQGRVDQQLGRAVGRVGPANQVLEQPPAAGEDRRQLQEGHHLSVALGDVDAMFG